MLLGYGEILYRICEKCDLKISPLLLQNIGPASVDLTLGSTVIIDGAKKTLDECGVDLNHGDMLLAATAEKVTLPNDIAGQVIGRSTMARLGLLVTGNAGFIDPGFSGVITLQIVNLGRDPVHLQMGERIWQITFTELESATSLSYGQRPTSHYQHQSEATGATNDKPVS